jgi:glycosyltransferase involved in cell wall biosynthesis
VTEDQWPGITRPIQPLVSVLIPAHDGERFITEAIRSAQAQTWARLEILVSDDASTDSTLSIVNRLAQDDPRIRILEQPENLGAPRNQIELHRQARGEIIKPLLQDDVLEPDAVQTLATPLMSTTAPAFSFGRRRLIDENGTILPDTQWTRPLTHQAETISADHLKALIVQAANPVGEVSCVAYRADTIPDDLWTINGREYQAIGDVALYLKLMDSNPNAFYTPKTLSWFRQHPDQSSHNPKVIQQGMEEWGQLLADPILNERVEAQAA